MKLLPARLRPRLWIRGLLVVVLGLAAVAQDGAEPDAEANAARRPNYTHPLGLAFRSPKRWRVEESVLGLSLVPRDRKRRGAMPREMYLANVAGMPDDVESLDDRRVAKQLKDLVRSAVPYLKPRGKPEPIEGVPGARTFRWRGTDPATKIKVVAWIHARAEQGYFLSVGGIGEEDVVDARRDEILEVFRSLQWGAPKTDAKLAGTWHSESFTSVGSVSSDRLNASHRQTVVLLPDGRMTSSGQTGIAGRTGGHDRPGTDVAGVVQGATELGRWASDGKAIYVLWREGGAAKFGVYVQGAPGRREMLLTPAGGGTKVLWTEY